MSKVIVTKSRLLELFDQGLDRKEMAEALGLPVTQINMLIKVAGLKGKRKKKISFQFIDDSSASEYEVPPILGIGVQEQIANVNLQYIQSSEVAREAIDSVVSDVVESTNTAVINATLGAMSRTIPVNEVEEEDSIEEGPLF